MRDRCPIEVTSLLRSSAALWTAPVWSGIVAFYFFYALHFEDSYEEVIGGPLWAAQQVARALNYFYAFAYGITLGLATWEGGRLKHDRVWDLAPSRARWRVAVQALAPAVGAGWAILLLPVVMRLVETRLLPTPTSVLPLVMEWASCARTPSSAASSGTSHRARSPHRSAPPPRTT